MYMCELYACVCMQTPHRVLNLVIGPVAGVSSVEVFVVVNGQQSNSLLVAVIPPAVLSISNSSCSSVSVTHWPRVLWMLCFPIVCHVYVVLHWSVVVVWFVTTDWQCIDRCVLLIVERDSHDVRDAVDGIKLR